MADPSIGAGGGEPAMPRAGRRKEKNGMTFRARVLLSILLPLLFVVPPVAARPLHLATYAYPDYDRQKALTPLARLIERIADVPVVISLLESPEELANAIKDGRVDLAVTNLAVFAATSDDSRVDAIAVLAVPDATLDRYRGVMLARRDVGVGALPDLRKPIATLRYAEVLPGSTSGALVQAGALREAGIEPSAFRSVERAGTHDAVLGRLLGGGADVGALAETPWRLLREKDPEGASQLVELWRSDPLPPGPILCIRSDHSPCDRIAAALLHSETLDEEIAAALAAGWSETRGATRFERVDPADYRSFIP